MKDDILEVILSAIMRKNIHTSMFLILNGYKNRAVRISSPNSVIFVFVGLDERRSLQEKGGYPKRISCSHFG